MTDTVTQLHEKRKPRPARGDGLFVTDEEMLARLNMPEALGYQTLAILDRDHKRTRFPQKQGLWGNRRYFPAVEAWLEHTLGLKVHSPRKRESDDE